MGLRTPDHILGNFEGIEFYSHENIFFGNPYIGVKMCASGVIRCQTDDLMIF